MLTGLISEELLHHSAQNISLIQVPPSEIQLIIKTHRTTVVIQTPLSATMQRVKSSVLSALNQFDNPGTLEDVPSINSEDDFELCKMDSSRYVALDASKGVRDQKLAAWATLYIRFRDQNGEFIFQHACAACGYWPQCLPLLHCTCMYSNAVRPL